ncbi:MAG TPA: TerC/Alx family metal homeostasis membrane protein [Myxococcota bacterium]|nr:TerC/Alx family metal homeostasis membrane protein [Myxococcota bacterium]
MIPAFWIGLFVLLLAALALDLGVFHREHRSQTTGEALLWSLVWIGTGLLFNCFVYFAYADHWLGIGLQVGHELDGWEAALQFLNAFLVEKSLSLDNIFVIATVFSYFAIPLESQYRVLYWGVLGALVMRMLFIVSGLALVERFAWTTYIFGAILLLTAAKMFYDRDADLEPQKNAFVRLLERWLPVTADLSELRFFKRCNGKLVATPLFLVLLVVETSDLLFAVDSIPAVIAVTRDPFLAFSSNAFAILGLRSLYFVIAPLIARFRFLKMSLIFLLAFVGVKMLLTHHLEIPAGVSLAFLLGILGVGILASVFGGQIDAASDPKPGAALDDLAQNGLRAAWRVVVGIVGFTVLALGLAMLVLPGPGLLVIPFGLAILATEFVWARRWLQKIRGNGTAGTHPTAIRKAS